MAGGRGQSEIRKNYPIVNTGEILSLEPTISNISKNKRKGLDDGN